MIRNKKALGAGAGLAAVLTLSMSNPAHADMAPTAADVVGVGSDTVQNIMNFVADGSTAGDAGYNTAGNINRLVGFDATPDSNDRAGYTIAGGTLNPTVILRAGQSPVQRPNGSGAGIGALLLDKTAPNSINWVRASRLPTVAEQQTASTNLGTSLHPVKIATDDLRVAAATATNAPSALTAAQLVSIYQCTATTWTAVGGTSAATINPLLPQAGSGTRSTFLADLQAANGGTAITIGSCVNQATEENDPGAITGAKTAAGAADSVNAIAPFSAGRLALYNSGYFKDPSVKFGNPPATLSAGIQLLAGVGSYLNSRGLYIIFRDSDTTSTVGFQPGGAKNFVNTLFLAAPGGTAPFVNSNAGRAAIAAGGVTPLYKDCLAGATSC